VQAAKKIASLGIRSISLADTVGLATPQLIGSVVNAITGEQGEYEIGVHMHSRRENAAAKILAAYDAGCRRFDSAIGGLGGCPFAQDALVGNIPTEIVIDALHQRSVSLPIRNSLERVMAMNTEIGSKFSL
jgi:hydroxymethylglutaryl-CoA lyase